MGNGDGTFAEPFPFEASHEWREADLEFGDLDGDGILDLVGRGGGVIFVHPGRGDGTFGEARAYSGGVLGREVELSDFDQDGRIDLLVTYDNVELLRNGTAEFNHPDCNENSVPDICEIAEGAAIDTDEDGVLDACEVDCDDDGVPDDAEIESGLEMDCDGDGRIDSCEIAAGDETDCNGNGFLDRCDLLGDASRDCDRNRVLDACDVANGAPDENGNSVPDTCESSSCRVPGDSNEDGRLDISDPVLVLRFLFVGQPRQLPCGDGLETDPGNVALLDWQSDGIIDLSDPVAALRFLFLAAPPHPLAVPGAERTGCVRIFGCATP